jgi:acetyl-CoA decarbonylase/synthase complex subunit gamma
MKYAGIVVLSGMEPWGALALVTVRQNIYTDPQKPIQIEEGLYEIGSPDASAPVMVTTNFSLTYFTVEGDVEASRVPAWVVVVDTEGTSVLTAWAAEKFTAEIIAEKVKAFDVASKVEHRKIILPGHVAVLSGKLEDELGQEWKVIVGPRESSGIPSFLRASWSA